jgi:hypothetical protein
MEPLGAIAFRADAVDDGFEYGRMAVAVCEQAFGKEHRALAYSLQWLAGAYLNRDRPAEALPLLERALRIRQALLPGQHPEVCRSREKLAEACAAVGAYDRAVELYRQLEPLQPWPGVFAVRQKKESEGISLLVCGQARLVQAFPRDRRLEVAAGRARLSAYAEVAEWLGRKASSSETPGPGAKDGEKAEAEMKRTVTERRVTGPHGLIKRLVEVRCVTDELLNTVSVYLASHPGAQGQVPATGPGSEGDYEVKQVSEYEAGPGGEGLTGVRTYLDGVLFESNESVAHGMGPDMPVDSTSTEFYAGGRPCCETVWKAEGGRHERAWYENGLPAGELTWVRPGETGTVTYWHENGRKREEMRLADGEVDGPETHWDEQVRAALARTWSHGILQ